MSLRDGGSHFVLGTWEGGRGSTLRGSTLRGSTLRGSLQGVDIEGVDIEGFTSGGRH